MNNFDLILLLIYAYAYLHYITRKSNLCAPAVVSYVTQNTDVRQHIPWNYYNNIIVVIRCSNYINNTFRLNVTNQ